MRRIVIGLVTVASVATLILAGAAGAAGRANELAAVRAATAAFHDFDAASDAGYGPLHICTDDAGVGAMGQHYVKFAIVGDTVVDPRVPEALMYEPLPGGGQRLVAVEWVVFQDAWVAAGNDLSDPPTLFGRTFAPHNGVRYGVPPFFQLHAWVWKPNPAGVFTDMNPRASCLGTGD